MDFHILIASQALPDLDTVYSLTNTVICLGGKLTTQWLLDAYNKVFFPWFDPDMPIQWWNPNLRALMYPTDIIIHKSMRPYFNQIKFQLRIDYAFKLLLNKARKRHEQVHGATWISDQIIREYSQLHQIGYAHSIEAWKDGELVGGLYGVSLGKMFFGESMFSIMPNASKFCFIALARLLEINGFDYIDCQVPNHHLKFLGCKEVPRTIFLEALKKNRKYQTVHGDWSKLLTIPPEFKKHFIPND